jgi:hypothetical protein
MRKDVKKFVFAKKQELAQQPKVASRKLTPASAFRQPSFQSGTGAKNAGLHRTIPVSDWLRHRWFFSVQYRTDRMPNSPVSRQLLFFLRRYFLRVQPSYQL